MFAFFVDCNPSVLELYFVDQSLALCVGFEKNLASSTVNQDEKGRTRITGIILFFHWLTGLAILHPQICIFLLINIAKTPLCVTAALAVKL